MTDLETLVRNTLRAKADTITTAPGWDGAPPQRTPSRLLAVAAAVVAVLALGGVLVGLRLATSDGGRPPAAAVTRTCTASLPAAWRTALDARPVPAPGGAVARPVAMTPDARTVVHWSARNADHYGLLGTGGATVRPLYDVPSGREVHSVDADAHTLVVNEIDRSRAQYGGPIAAVVTVDLGTGRSATIYRPAKGDAVGSTPGSAAVIDSGHVYWSVLHTGSRPATLRQYDVRSSTTTTIGDLADPTVSRDERGVHWSGGGAARGGVPPAAGHVTGPVVSDGNAYAWQPDGRSVDGVFRGGQRIRWVDRDGTTHTITVRGVADPSVLLVSGPFVLLGAPGANPAPDGDPTPGLLLDVRTGALAPIDTPAGPAYASARRWSLAARTGIVRVDTRTLPGLSC